MLAAVAIAVVSGFTIPSIAGIVLSAGMGIAGVAIAWRRGAGRWLFGLVILAALVDVVLLVLAGQRILNR